MIIGIAGEISAGKTTVRDVLDTKSFSLTNIIKEELQKEGSEINRTNLRNKGDFLRSVEGLGVLAKRTAEKIKSENLKTAVVDSIRHPDEVRALRDEFGDEFIMFFITADPEIRYKRSLDRKKYEEEEQPSFSDFIQLDNHDRTIGIDECKDISDFVIVNEGSFDDLRKEIFEKLGRLK